MSNIAWLIPLAPLIGCLICALMQFRRRGEEVAHFPAIAGLVTAAIASLYLLSTSEAGQVTIVEGFQWLSIGRIELPVSLRFDGISLSQLNVVTWISLLVAIYSTGYMKGDPGYTRFFAVISAFVFSMTMLVLAGNLLVLYAFWECVGLCSYLLIGFWFQKPSAAAAAMKAFLVNRLADCGFLIGIITLWYGVGLTEVSTNGVLGRLDFDTIFQAVPILAERHPDLLGWVGFLLLIGAIGKSAQFPFHVWLPDAMEGPTPVSALIHAATMVTAGVYLLARMSPLLELTPNVLIYAGWLGAITALLAGTIALFQDDLKRVLAYSTVSQLGYMVLAFGAGLGEHMISLAVVAAMFHLITHAFFKALLFLSAGNVMHAMGDVIDMRQFSGLRKVLPSTHILFLIGALALAGCPPLAGFFSKESILGLLASQTGDPQYGGLFMVWLVMGLATALLTAIYTFRAYFRTFHGPERFPEEVHHPHEASTIMLGPLAVLAVGSVLSGVILFFTDGLNKFILPIRYVSEAHHEHHENIVLVVVSIALVAVGAWLARWSTTRATSEEKATASPTGFASVAGNRFYLDEIFYGLLVLPLQKLADAIGFFDLNVVDGLIRAVSSIPSAIGKFGRRLQTGLVPSYALTMVFGIVALIALACLRR
jgi:NADH-quinone oxidoreductase subunit L